MSGKQSELTLEEMLADPIVQLVMNRDGLVADDVRTIMSAARGAWRPHDLTLFSEIGLGAEAANTP